MIKIRAKELLGWQPVAPGVREPPLAPDMAKIASAKNPILFPFESAKDEKKRAAIGNRRDSQDARAANPPGGGRQAAPSKVRKEQRNICARIRETYLLARL